MFLWKKLELINVNGQVVQQIPLQQQGVQEIAVGDLEKGLYFIRLTTDVYSWQQRVIIN